MLNCPDCGQVNPDDFSFCPRCGATLAKREGERNEEEEPELEDSELTPTPVSRSLELEREGLEKRLPDILDRNLREIVRTFREAQERKDKIAEDLLGIDKNILNVFSVALLATLFFIFYMAAVDKLNTISAVLYPIFTGILGFLGGYFAGSGRVKGKNQ